MRVLRWLLIGRTDGLRARARRRLRQVAHPGPRGPVAHATPAHPAGGVTNGALDAGRVPAGFEAVLRQRELQEGALREVFVGGRSVALALVDGQVYAMDGTCPHAGGPLAEGLLDGTTLSCPMHGWSFDVVTGECHVNPEDRIRILAVRVVDDVVCVEA
mgnify:CR=1 FL=1